jgi:hypothetical protein
VTSSNALRYAYATSGDERTRQLLLLQNVAFLPLFHEAMRGRGSVADRRIDQLQPEPVAGERDQALSDIFSAMSRNRGEAASGILGYLQQENAESLIDEARRLVFLKGTDSHDYKFSSAVLEDYYCVSPAWRDKYLASAAFHLRGSETRDNQLVERVRSALEA